MKQFIPANRLAKVKPDPVPRETIEKLLSAAVQAPNHYKVRPWRFVVLTGAARERLGDVMAAVLHARTSRISARCVRKAKRKNPTFAGADRSGSGQAVEAKVIEIENVCAAAAAVENLLLAAHDQGLAAKWRTGGPATIHGSSSFWASSQTST